MIERYFPLFLYLVVWKEEINLYIYFCKIVYLAIQKASLFRDRRENRKETSRIVGRPIATNGDRS